MRLIPRNSTRAMNRCLFHGRDRLAVQRFNWQWQIDPPSADSPPTLMHIPKQPSRPDAGDPKAVYRLQWQQRCFALKVRYYHSLRQRLRLRRNPARSTIDNEIRMTRLALDADLPVLPVVARLHRRIAGLPTLEGFLRPWADGYHPLDETPHPPDLFEPVARLLGRIREAGLADSDFNLSQILRHPDAANPRLLWIDLERAYTAPPEHPDATGQLVGRTLASAAITFKLDQHALSHLASHLLHAMPPADNNTLHKAIHTHFHHLVQRALHRKQLTTPPNPPNIPL